MLFTGPETWLMPTPLHLLLPLVLLSTAAWRRGSRLRRWRWLLFLFAAWCWITATPAFAHWLLASLEDDHAAFDPAQYSQASPVILVLAAGDGYEPSLPDDLQLNLASYRRTQRAVDIWRTLGGTLLFSGRTAMDGAHPVAQRMAAFARRLGVPEEHVRSETESLNTWQNLAFAARRFETRQPVVLVTSAMHMPRAMQAAQACGVDAIAAPADFRAHRKPGWRAWLPNSDSLPMLDLALHEWLGRAWYALREDCG